MLHLRRNHGTEALESTGTRNRARTVVKARLAATTGWLLVNVVRKVRQTSDVSGSHRARRRGPRTDATKAGAD